MEVVGGSMHGTLVDDVVLDGLDQKICDAEPKFLDAKSPLYQGSSVSKLEADLMMLEMKSSNCLSDCG